jgi:hypothetical protein
MLDRMLACSAQKRARVDEVLNGGSDTDMEPQSYTHHTDAEGDCEHETTHESDSDDCGM